VLSATRAAGSVVRPVLVHGRGGSPPLLALIRAARVRGLSRWPDAGDNHWSTIHVDDLPAVYPRLGERPAGRAINAASGHTLPVRTLARANGSAVGVAACSAPVAEIAADIGGFAALLTLDQRFTGATTRALLDWEPTGPDLPTDLRSAAYRNAH
jgi:nucleoside-diphosphate-sugar epimerase